MHMGGFGVSEGAAPLTLEGVEEAPTLAVEATIYEPPPVVVAAPVTTLVVKRTTVDWIIDYAKTDRCECHRSGEVITRGELRVMRRNTASTGFQMAYSYKLLPFFQMMSRMAVATSKPATAAGLVGLGELSAADQEMLDGLFKRYQDPSDDFPPAEAKGQCAAAIRKHRRPQLERRFLCPAPGCTKAYSSAGCLSQHKRDKHPELLRGRLRGPTDGCPPCNLALAAPGGSSSSTALAVSATPASLAQPPPGQPHAPPQVHTAVKKSACQRRSLQLKSGRPGGAKACRGKGLVGKGLPGQSLVGKGLPGQSLVGKGLVDGALRCDLA